MVSSIRAQRVLLSDVTFRAECVSTEYGIGIHTVNE